MKKLALFAVLSALVLAGCTENNIDTTRQTIIIPDLTAGFADEPTRTYVENGKYLRWHEADLITAFYGNALNRQYKFNGTTGANNGTFSLVPSGELGTGNTLGAIYAVYPYDTTASISDEGVISLTLPATQLYAENSFGKGANTMIAVTENIEDTFLGFKNACGYLKLKLYNAEGVRIRSIEVKGNNEEKIAGPATATIEFGSAPELAMGEDATTTVTLDCGEEGVALGTTAETATEFWVVLPEVTFENGITISVTDLFGGVYEKATSNKVAIVRNDIQPMAALGVEYVKTNYEIGDLVTYGGADGIVFYIDDSIVKLVSVTEKFCSWGPSGETKAKYSTDGFKNMETIKALNPDLSEYPAFKWCNDYGFGWYLPGSEEYRVLYKVQGTVNQTLKNNGLTVLNTHQSWYWASNEYNSSTSYVVDFNSGYTQQYYRNNPYYVRAVCAFERQ